MKFSEKIKLKSLWRAYSREFMNLFRESEIHSTYLADVYLQHKPGRSADNEFISLNGTLYIPGIKVQRE